jgi:hypothetical protein
MEAARLQKAVDARQPDPCHDGRLVRGEHAGSAAALIAKAYACAAPQAYFDHTLTLDRYYCHSLFQSPSRNKRARLFSAGDTVCYSHATGLK